MFRLGRVKSDFFVGVAMTGNYLQQQKQLLLRFVTETLLLLRFPRSRIISLCILTFARKADIPLVYVRADHAMRRNVDAAKKVRIFQYSLRIT